VQKDASLLVIALEVLGIDPHALAHQERSIVHMLAGLDLEALVKLADHERQLGVEQIEEQIDVALGADGKAWKIDGREGEVATTGNDLIVRVEHVRHDARAAAHVADLGFGSTLVVLDVERRVLEAEVREQPLGGAVHRKLEQIVVRIAWIVVDAFLDTEDLNREDRRLAMAETILGREQRVLDDHAALSARIHSVIHRAERRLRARTAVHGVQVVDERLHGLEGRTIGVICGLLLRILANLLRRLLVHAGILK